MQYTREQQEKFLDEELSAISDKYIQLIRKKAIALMESGEVFVSQYMKTDEQGCAILKMRNSRGLPRKGDYFCAALLVGEMSKFKNWGDNSWADLRRKYQKEFSEVYCVWLGKTDNPEFSFVGIKGITLELANELKPECILVLGPQEPPIKYYQNLISIVRDEPADSAVGKMMDYDRQLVEWSPVKLSAENSTGEFFRGQLALSDEIVVQGPPGTGKTYKMASLIADLPEEASVLVTALTNRALMELAGKEALEKKLEAGCVYKTSLTTDEQKELPKLQRIDGTDIHCIPGNLSLATFYAASNWAKKIDDQPPFDYVIMDEASQGFFVMVCAAKKLGKKVIWIGDQCQMPPVINMNPDKLLEKNWGPLSSGFKTLCENFSYPSYLLSDTYRLTERACAFTGIFYNGALRSVAKQHNDLPVANLSPGGGPSLLMLPLEPGNRSPKNMIDTALSMVKDLLAYDSKLEIAILAKFRATVKNMQRAFITHFGEQKNVLIDTVERVQGLTCDVCFFCIPNDLQYMSLEKTFFNVATSRSVFNTVIICDENMLNTVNMNTEVRNYLVRVKSNSVPAIEKPTEAGQQPELKVLGKIDLSKFERKKKEISELKRNYYVIDTNVFVNCPDIIDKINKDYPVILSAKVVDELDKMKIKLDEQGKRNAEKALRYLNSSPAHEIIYEQADTSLLPDDFDKRSPDNLILSVALKYKNENPIILTSDNGLQLKAKIVKIQTVSLKDFLRR